MAKSWVKVVALTRIPDYLLTRGLEPADIMRRFPVPLLSSLDRDLWIDRDEVFAMSTSLAALVDDPCLGLHIGEVGDLLMYGRMGEGVTRSVDVGSALRFAIDNVSMMETGRQFCLRTHNGRARFQSDFLGPARADPTQTSQVTVRYLKRFLNLAEENVPLEVRLPFAKPANTDEYERLLGPNLVFGADAAAVDFEADALSVPLRPVEEGSDDARNLSGPACFVRTVVKSMQEIIPFERPSALAVASELGVTIRTMQRQLKLWGTTYEELLNEFLMLRAVHLLRSKRYTVTDVAFDIGYSDSAHFARAFKRWTGCTPHEFRVRGEEPIPALASASLRGFSRHAMLGSQLDWG